MKNNWYVFTGGPSCGKTTLITEFERFGYPTVPEAARAVIDEGLALGKTVEEMREDERGFQDAILRQKIALEASLEPRTITFLDRGIHDTQAYMDLQGLPMESWALEAIRTAKYRKVFWLEPLANFERDYARIETVDEVAALNGLLFEVYANAGMEPIRVPAVGVPDRVQFILDHVYNDR